MLEDLHRQTAFLEAAFVAGLLMAAADAALVPVFDHPLHPHSAFAFLHLLILPLLSGALGGLGERTPRIALDLVFAAIGFGLGSDLVWGDRAAATSVAPLVPWGLALGLPIFVRLTPRMGRRWPYAVLAIGLYAISAWPWHAHYHRPRRWLLLLSLMASTAALASMIPRWRRTSRARWITIIILLLLLAAALVSLRRQETAEWAESSTTGLGALAREASQWRLSRSVSALEGDRGEDLDSDAARGVAARAAEGREGAPAVLVVVIDALREDVVDRDLQGRPLMPRLLARAPAGLRFRRAYAAAPYSLLSLNALFRGVSPGRLLADTGPQPESLASRLRREGGETRAAFSRRVTPASPAFPDPDLGFSSRLAFELDDPAPEQLIDALRPRDPDQAYLGYLHLMGPHAPYEDPEGRAGADAGPFERYLAEVAAADELLDDVLKELLTPGLRSRLLLIVTADHGEEFREHGRLFHGHNLYAESIHVPLMIWGPGLERGQNTAVVSALDLAPTIDQWLGLGSLGRPIYSGRSLLGGLLGDRKAAWPNFALAELPERGERSLPARASLITPQWSFTLDDRRDRRYLFDLSRDPGERTNLARLRPDITSALESRLRAQRGRVPPAREVFPEATRYRANAESRAALRTFLERHHETLEIPFVARALALMGIGPIDAADFDTARQFQDHPAAAIRRAAVLVLAREPGAEPQDLRSLANTIEDAVVLAALEEALAEAADFESLPNTGRAAELQYGGVWLAATLRRTGRAAQTPEIEILMQLLEAEEPWFFDQLAALLVSRGSEGARRRLREVRERPPEERRRLLNEALTPN